MKKKQQRRGEIEKNTFKGRMGAPGRRRWRKGDFKDARWRKKKVLPVLKEQRNGKKRSFFHKLGPSLDCEKCQVTKVRKKEGVTEGAVPYLSP